MGNDVKSGKQVVDEFFSEIMNIEGVEYKTADALCSLYKEGKLTATNIENTLDQILQDELETIEVKNGKD